MATVIKAPHPFDHRAHALFLAGSIEMDNAPDWRGVVKQRLEDSPITILDPWRDDWNDSWEQSLEDDNFRTQVEWELEALTSSDAILMYFAPGTTAPISLLELGLFAKSGKMIVCCPDGFWRKGNVDVVCERYGIPHCRTLDEAVQLLSEEIRCISQ